MSAEVLRRAATKMRERANETSKPENMHPWGDTSIPAIPLSGWSGEVNGYLGGPMGEHCAAWHPAVALTVADWLDACALVVTAAPDATKAHAERVARAYLGDQP